MPRTRRGAMGWAITLLGLGLTITAASSGEQAAPSVSWRIRIQTPIEAQGEKVVPEGQVRLRRRTPPPHLEQVAHLMKEETALLLPPGTWEATFRLPGYWAADQLWNVAPEHSRLVHGVPALPAIRVAGHIKRVPESPELRPSPVPSLVDLRFEPVARIGQAPSFPRSRQLCPVDPQGRFGCEVPAGLLDLAVRLEGHVPVYRWGVAATRPGPVELGEFVLRRGASVTATIALARGRLETGRGLARLLPATFEGHGALDPAVGERLRRSDFTLPVPADGFVQFSGVPPGLYQIEVTYPEHAPAFAGPIAVSLGVETSFRDPVVLRPPLDLVVRIRPTLDPQGQPWKLTLSPRGSEAENSPSYATADPSGAATFKQRAPGRYRVSLEDSLGNRPHHETWEVQDEGSAQLDVEIPGLLVSGRALLGNEPLRHTEVVFGTRRGTPSVSLQTGEGGEFSGWLPRAGGWMVELSAQEPVLELVKWLEIPEGRDRQSEVEIRVPENRVVGNVFDELEQPVPGALVLLQSYAERGIREVRTDHRGEFDLRHAPPGPAWVNAELTRSGADHSSEPVHVTVPPEGDLAGVRLVLRAEREVKGRVVAASGPVAGVALSFEPTRALGGEMRRALSGPDGEFQIYVPSSWLRLRVTLFPPGFALDSMEVVLSKEPLQLPVTHAGGLLELRGSEGTRDDEAAVLFLKHGNSLVRLEAIASWAAATPGARWALPLRVPRVAPGPWSLCFVPREAVEKMHPTEEEAHALLAAATCASGTLEPGGTLVLDLTRQLSGAEP